MGSHNSTSPRPIPVSLKRYGDADPQLLHVFRKRYRLTPTQARVAMLLADRLTNAEIAAELGIRPGTARSHTEAVLLRLDVTSRLKVVSLLAEFFAERGEV